MDKILLGHVNQDTAFYVSDYPFGYRERCRIRYWIETSEKGAKKGEMRMVSQTTNPKKGHPEFWNKPHPGIYCPLLLMVQREDNGHIESRGLDFWSGPERFDQIRSLQGMWTAELLEKISKMELVSRKCNLEAWKLWDREKAKASNYVSDAAV